MDVQWCWFAFFPGFPFSLAGLEDGHVPNFLASTVGVRAQDLGLDLRFVGVAAGCPSLKVSKVPQRVGFF